MDPVVTAAIVSVGGSIIVQVLGLISINKLLTYRVEELEKLVEKHSRVVDKVDAIEMRVHYNEKEIDRISRLQEVKN